MKRERAEELFNLLGDIDEAIIEEADIMEKKSTQILQIGQKKSLRRYVMIAASIAFLLVCIWGVRGIIDQLGMNRADSDMAFVAEDADSDWEGDVDESGWDEDDADWEDDEAGDWVEEESVDNVVVDRQIDFTHELTEEELVAIFPSLEYEVTADALFLDDGTLIEVEGLVLLPTGEQLLIRVAEDEVQHNVNCEPEEISQFTISGVEVMVCDNDTTTFMLDDIAYFLEFFDEGVVNQIVLGGPADLSVLSEVLVP